MTRAAHRILVVDDDPFMLKLLAHMLAQLGFTRVSTADSGRAALDQLEGAGEAPALILLDLNMPDMDGVEFVRKLVEHGYRGNLALVSGEEERVLQMASNLVHAHHVNMIGHLGKPFVMDRLAAIIERSRRLEEVDGDGATMAYDAERLRAAIDAGEIVNFYQPKVDVASLAVVGAEALARWRHPQDGLVLPQHFIALAEEQGLIDALARVVARDAIAQLAAWRRTGLNLRIAINVSMENLADVTFVDFIAAEVASNGIAPNDLVFEVTESRLMRDRRAPLESFTRLRLNRYALSIDDFGTGHSSLSLLRDIPFDELKIDRSFVHEAWSDPTPRAIYNASLALGRQLGMVVVAEGVEDADDWDLVRSTHCDLAQGFHIAHPMPAGELPAWVESWKRDRQRNFAPG
jgi:EAL domain-containing protein (putative c-di-GMP-specific phosphodiesterase class I)/ActR/RegA family two-component response regulator